MLKARKLNNIKIIDERRKICLMVEVFSAQECIKPGFQTCMNLSCVKSLPAFWVSSFKKKMPLSFRDYMDLYCLQNQN